MRIKPSPVFYLIIPVIQIVYFIFFYDLVNYAAHKMNRVYSRGVQWGITMEQIVIEYIAIVMLLGFFVYYVKRKALLFTAVAAVVFAALVFPYLNDLPYRAGVVIVIGVTGIFINYLFWLVGKPATVDKQP